MKKNRRTEEEWIDIYRQMDEAKKQGTSTTEFLRSKGIAYNSFHNAVVKFKLKKQAAAIKKGTFVEFVPSNQLGIRVEFPSGAVVSVARNDKEGLKTVLAVASEINR